MPIDRLKSLLKQYLGINIDAVSLIMALSVIATRIDRPFHLCVSSTSTTADEFLRNKLLDLISERVGHITTNDECRRLLKKDFDDIEVLNVVSSNEKIFEHACQCSQTRYKIGHQPTVWWIGAQSPRLPLVGPTLVLRPEIDDRHLTGFAEDSLCVLSPSTALAKQSLQTLFQSIRHRPAPDTRRFAQFPMRLADDEKVILIRLLSVIALLRLEFQIQDGVEICPRDFRIESTDYRDVRDLLISLPVPHKRSTLTPQAVETGRVLFDAIHASNFSNNIPDHSDLGNKVFTRQHATRFTGAAYNTVKAHLKELTNEGIVEDISVRMSNSNARVQRQGVQIFYKFNTNTIHLLHGSSPFTALPAPDEIDANRNP